MPGVGEHPRPSLTMPPHLSASPDLSLSRTSYIICGVQCKSKMQDLLSKDEECQHGDGRAVNQVGGPAEPQALTVQVT